MHYADLVIVFFLPKSPSNTKNHAEQYTRLLKRLNDAGLYTVGKRGRRQGEILILVRCSERKLDWLARRDRYA
jgi:anoctamin-10